MIKKGKLQSNLSQKINKTKLPDGGEFIPVQNKVLPHDAETMIVVRFFKRYFSSFPQHSGEVSIKTKMRFYNGPCMNGAQFKNEL